MADEFVLGESVAKVVEKLNALRDELSESGYVLTEATSTRLGGIKIGYTENGANLPVKLSNEKAYVPLSGTAVTSALGYTPLSTTGGSIKGALHIQGLLPTAEKQEFPDVNEFLSEWRNGQIAQMFLFNDGSTEYIDYYNQLCSNITCDTSGNFYKENLIMEYVSYDEVYFYKIWAKTVVEKDEGSDETFKRILFGRTSCRINYRTLNLIEDEVVEEFEAGYDIPCTFYIDANIEGNTRKGKVADLFSCDSGALVRLVFNEDVEHYEHFNQLCSSLCWGAEGGIFKESLISFNAGEEGFQDYGYHKFWVRISAGDRSCTAGVKTYLVNQDAQTIDEAEAQEFTIADSNCTAYAWSSNAGNTIVTLNRDSKVEASRVAPSELDSLLGITGNVQKQLDEKLGKTEKVADSDKLDGQDSSYYLDYNNLSNKPTIPSAYSLPLSASGTRGGIQIGYTASGANIPLQLSSEKAYVALTSSAVISALSYTPIKASDLSGYATKSENTANLTEAKSYTDTKIAALINSSPATLDTLDELAAALGDDPNFATTVSTKIGNNTSAITALQTSVAGKLEKTTYEKSAELACGSNGKVCLGKFGAYDTNITIELNSTTSTTYHATIIIHSQNVVANGTGGTVGCYVYGDADNHVTPLISVFRPYGSASRQIEVYANLAGWSKNLVHVQAVALSDGGMTDVLTSVSEIPTEITGKTKVTPVNVLTTAFLGKTAKAASASVADSANAVAWGNVSSKPSFATVATSGSYADLTNKPTIPTKTSQLTNDSGYIKSYTETDPTVPAWAKAASKPSYSYSEITGKPTLATVATSGSYNDLTNKPAIPSAYSLPLAASGTRGGIQIGYTASGANIPLQLSSEKAYVALTKSAVTSALGYTPPTSSDISTAISNLVDSSPDALNTLNELAAALGDDPNFATTIATQIGGKLSTSGGTITGDVTMSAASNANSANFAWGTVNSNTPYFGYASDQTDGTFVWSLKGTNYASGLAIGGGSGNLLWKGTRVATTEDIPAAYTLPNATSSTLGGVKVGSNITVSGGTISLSKDNVTAALGYTPPTTNTTYSQATSSALGLVKIGYTENGKNYPVELNSSGQMFVNVPWETGGGGVGSLTDLGVTATAAELNYVDGVTSNIQTQLNGKLPVFTQSSYNANTAYDAGLYMVASGSNLPSGTPYGSLLTLPYRKGSGNNSPDFGTQIFIPNGDDATRPNSMFFRTSLSGQWNAWQEVAKKSDIPAAYTLPTASSTTLGGVKTTSTVTSTSGLTACPIIGGVPYYKDTTYSLSSFGINASATELNYTDGVTSNIQTQLNGKLSTTGLYRHDITLTTTQGELWLTVVDTHSVAYNDTTFRQKYPNTFFNVVGPVASWDAILVGQLGTQYGEIYGVLVYANGQASAVMDSTEFSVYLDNVSN